MAWSHQRYWSLAGLSSTRLLPTNPQKQWGSGAPLSQVGSCGLLVGSGLEGIQTELAMGQGSWAHC